MFKRYKSHIIAINNILIFIEEIPNSCIIYFDAFKSIISNINYKLKFKQDVNTIFFAIFA